MKIRDNLALAGEVILLSILAAALGGCEVVGSMVQPAPEAASAATAEKFGDDFASIAEANPTDKPREVEAADLPPVSLSDQPVDF